MAASFESNHAPNTSVNIARKYLLEGYKVKANMEIILVVYVNEQLKINKTLQLIWDRNFILNSKYSVFVYFSLRKAALF